MRPVFPIAHRLEQAWRRSLYIPAADDQFTPIDASRTPHDVPHARFFDVKPCENPADIRVVADAKDGLTLQSA